jgi:hypothetical protein
MWADMLALVPGAIAHLPPGIIAYDWYYYPFGRRPRLELRNFAEYDVAPALRARGIEYWGCPMNGSFRHEPLPVFGETPRQHPRLVAAVPRGRRRRHAGHLVGAEPARHGDDDGRRRGRGLPLA